MPRSNQPGDRHHLDDAATKVGITPTEAVETAKKHWSPKKGEGKEDEGKKGEGKGGKRS